MNRNPNMTLAECESLCLTGELGIITPDDVVAASALVSKLAAKYEERVDAHAQIWKRKNQPRRNQRQTRHPVVRSGMDQSLPAADRE